jgi:hypothetical protein
LTRDFICKNFFRVISGGYFSTRKNIFIFKFCLFYFDFIFCGLAFYFILFFWQSAERILCAEGGLFGRPLKGKEKGAMRVFFFTPRRAEK